MITTEIAFHAPRELGEALALLAEHRDEAKVLAGGMSLVPTMNLGLARPEVVVSLNHVAGLDAIEEDDGAITLGALVRHVRIARDPVVERHLPLLREAAAVIGDPQVRNRGSVGGSVAHADPAADYLPVLAVLDASIVVRSIDGERTVTAADFFMDIMLTALEPHEIVSAIRIPKLAPGDGSAYRRLARIEGSFPIVNAAAVVRAGRTSGRVGIGGVAGRPIMVDVSEALARGAGPDALDAVSRLAEQACTGAFADLSGDSEYRQAMAGVYAKRAVEAAAAAAEA